MVKSADGKSKLPPPGGGVLSSHLFAGDDIHNVGPGGVSEVGSKLVGLSEESIIDGTLFRTNITLTPSSQAHSPPMVEEDNFSELGDASQFLRELEKGKSRACVDGATDPSEVFYDASESFSPSLLTQPNQPGPSTGVGDVCPFNCVNRITGLPIFKSIFPHISKQHFGLHKFDNANDQRISTFRNLLQKHRKWACLSCSSILSEGYPCSCKSTFDTLNRIVALNLMISTNAPSTALIDPPCEDTPSDDTGRFFEWNDVETFDALITDVSLKQFATVESIPKSCRRELATIFGGICDSIATNPSDLWMWFLFLCFPKFLLRRLPFNPLSSNSTIVSRNKLQENFIFSQLDKWKSKNFRLLFEEFSTWDCLPREPFTSQSLKKSIINKVSQGRLSDAVKLLGSNGVHPISQRVLQILKEKHPDPITPIEIPPLPAYETFDFSFNQIKTAISSFKKGSGSGNDGFKPQYLKDFLSVKTDDSRSVFLGQLNRILSTMVSKELPSALAKWLGCANLIPLCKKDDGVRPIAVGLCFRRLVSKLLLDGSIKKEIENFLSPSQVGVGTAGGVEAAVGAVKRLVEKFGDRDDFVLIKVDALNAFNLVNRSKFLEVVSEKFPKLARWVSFIYGSQPALVVGESILWSKTGTQQGDPLGPLLFAIAIHGLIMQIKDVVLLDESLEGNIWYLDDGSICGKTVVIGRIIEFLISKGPEFGFFLCKEKCEAWWPTPNIDLWNLHLPEDFIFNVSSGTSLLGTVIGDSSASEDIIGERIVKIEQLIDNIEIVQDPQIELALLRACTGFPKFSFILRGLSPVLIPEALRRFDTIIHSALERITGSSIDEETRFRMHFPIRLGGLGIPIASKIAWSAYSGAQIQTLHLQNQLLGSNFFDIPSEQHRILEDFISNSPDALKNVTIGEINASKKPQHFLTRLSYNADFQIFSSSILDPRRKILLEASKLPFAGLWLSALPIKSLNLHISAREFQCCLKYYFGIPMVNKTFSCNACNHMSDVWGAHVVKCNSSGALNYRHNHIRNALFKISKEAQFDCSLEEPNLIDRSRERPGDVFYPNFTGGKSCCLDITVRDSSQDIGSRTPLEGLQLAADQKVVKYLEKCNLINSTFTPFVMDSLGGFHKSAIKHVKILTDRWGRDREISRGVAKYQILQRLSVALMSKQGSQWVSNMGSKFVDFASVIPSIS